MNAAHQAQVILLSLVAVWGIWQLGATVIDVFRICDVKIRKPKLQKCINPASSLEGFQQDSEFYFSVG
jgi:hypothetical protein